MACMRAAYIVKSTTPWNTFVANTPGGPLGRLGARPPVRVRYRLLDRNRISVLVERPGVTRN
jgi:hypothetical protein